MKSKHTQGHWKSMKVDSGNGHVIYAPTKDGHFTLAVVRHPDPQIQAANAKLMAAAPRLLECLRDNVTFLYAIAEEIGSMDTLKSCQMAAKRICDMIRDAEDVD